MRYPIDVKPDGKFFLVTFPDIPEAITQGKSLKEAKEVAANALETALDFYFENSRVVPKPSRIKRGQDFVELPASVSAKVLLLNEMIRQRVRPAELARRMQTTPQEVADEHSSHFEDRWDRRGDEGPRQDAGDSRCIG